jgi:hypothetical protein
MDKKIIYLVKVYALKYNVGRDGHTQHFYRCVDCYCHLDYYLFNLSEIRKGTPTLPYKKSRFGVTREKMMRSIRDGLIASLMLLFAGGFLWILYGDTIMNTIDNLQQGKIAGSLSNNTIIGTKNPLDQIIIENLEKIK